MNITSNISADSPWFGEKWPKTTPKQLNYDDSITLYDVLSSNAKENPEDPAIWFLDTWVSYVQLKDMVDRFATGLLDIGIHKGEVLALILPNSIQFVVAYYAACKIGVIITPVNPTYKIGEVKHQLSITATKHIIILDALYETLVAPLRDDLSIQTVIVTNLVDMATGMSTIKKLLGKALKKIPSAKVPQAIQFKSLLNFPPNSPRADIIPSKDVQVYLMTGGTTGIPKAAMLSYTNLYVDILQTKVFLGDRRLKEEDPITGPKTGNIGILPLFHAFAMTAIMNFSMVTKGWMILFPKPPATKEFCETMEKLPDYNGFIYTAVEILFQRISEFEDAQKYSFFKKIRFCISGAGPLHDYVQKKFEKNTQSFITEGYGLTEASPVVSTGSLFNEPRSVGTIGFPHPGTEWSIFPSNNFEQGPLKGFGEEFSGELCICGPQVMLGYLNEPERTAETIKEFDGKLWLLTGDIGYMDEFGRVIIRDRKKQLIKTRGHSVFPSEVESLVGNHPDVLDVACAGVPDENAGEIVKIWVALKQGSTLTKEKLFNWCKENISHFKLPREIEFR
ncbi:MAG: AMP-binding protein, partial [Promethearchaeota archaeon]